MATEGFDPQVFVAEMREINVAPHVAQNDSGRCSAIDGRTTRHTGYAVSLRIRKRIEYVTVQPSQSNHAFGPDLRAPIESAAVVEVANVRRYVIEGSEGRIG